MGLTNIASFATRRANIEVSLEFLSFFFSVQGFFLYKPRIGKNVCDSMETIKLKVDGLATVDHPLYML
jgi:hypothetical protein